MNYSMLSAVAAVMLFTVECLAADRPPTYNRDVRPILSDKCFPCHGPDAKKREADLRLDVSEGAIASGAITPGEPGKSELITRITSDDPDVHMPPPKSKLDRLSPSEV